MGGKFLFTSESVTEGHPDKVSDQISDAVLDAIYAKDPQGRVACETLVATNLCVLAGEITSKFEPDYEAIARKTITDIGYTDAASGIDGAHCEVFMRIHQQSPDIARGVDEGGDHEQGAGDQGMMFGYACNETPELMPMPIQLAHRLTEKLAAVRRAGKINWLRPDGKSQVTVEYDDGKPVRVSAVVISTQHTPEVSQKQNIVREAMIEEVIKPIIPAHLLKNTEYFVNPTGCFEVGGPHGDSGLTGRKIIVDTYGGMGRHGGGAFSGKDPSKVDRSACYAVRHIAKNVVAAGLADRCEVQVAYAIGVARPVSINVNTFGTLKQGMTEETLAKRIAEEFDMRPRALIERLNLRRPIYRDTASYGHFGRELDSFTWEKKDFVSKLRD